MKKASALILVFCVAALFQGCNRNNETTNGAAQKELRLAFIGSSSDDY